MAKVPTLAPVVFEKDKDTKNKKRFGSPDGADLQGVLYIPNELVPDGYDLHVIAKFVKKED
jgi:hypothetical protein